MAETKEFDADAWRCPKCGMPGYPSIHENCCTSCANAIRASRGEFDHMNSSPPRQKAGISLAALAVGYIMVLVVFAIGFGIYRLITR